MHVVCTFSFCNNNLYEISSICTHNFNPYFLYKSHYSNFSSFVFTIKTYVSINLCVFHYLCMNSLLYIIDHPLLPTHLSITPLYSCLCIINICIKYFSNEDPNPENLKTLKILTNTVELRIVIPQKWWLPNTDDLRIGILAKRLAKYYES